MSPSEAATTNKGQEKDKVVLSEEKRIKLIEQALIGLSISDAQYLLRKVGKELTDKSLVYSA